MRINQFGPVALAELRRRKFVRKKKFNSKFSPNFQTDIFKMIKIKRDSH